MNKTLLLALGVGLGMPLFAQNVVTEDGTVVAVEGCDEAAGRAVSTRATNWSPVGSGKFIESFYDYVGIYFEDYLDPDLKQAPVAEELVVDFEKNDDVPGVYRIVNPYKNWSGNDCLLFSYDDLHNYYLVINAQDPEYVYIETGESGVKFDGEMTKIHSNIFTFVGMYGVDLTKEFYPGGGGKLINGVLTFPVDVEYAPEVSMLVHAISNILYTSCPANGTGHLEIVFPEGITGESGVATVGKDNAPIEYYNLNGVKIDNPDKGIFIVRQGDKAYKVIR